ncbi:MAG: ketoacyl-ACP synthase III [Holosporales bacterium]|jgi:3-oxoacyl-[acyl-carrier-protein] synthase-3|nr:ketoacyl-ACP synthase III [Holosporales bacterium]
MDKRSIISSLETYLPPKVLTNDDLSKIVDTSDEWIVERTGIKKRHITEPGEFSAHVAIKAALKTLEAEGIDPLEIDSIVVATVSSEKRTPSCAVIVQDAIGARNAFAFDVQAACGGFMHALCVADSFIRSGSCKKVLTIGADALSKFVDWTDRSTCVLLGDGAGACIVKEAPDNSSSGIIDIKLYADGSKSGIMSIETSEKNDSRGYFTMQGRAVFKCAVDYMYDAMVAVLTKNNMTFDDVDWIVPHQANKRILEAMHKINGLPIEKVIITIEEHANTSSASIPLAIKKSMDDETIKKGDTLLIAAIGAGLVWGSAILRI